jgi:hypothetical protein
MALVYASNAGRDFIAEKLLAETFFDVSFVH